MTGRVYNPSVRKASGNGSHTFSHYQHFSTPPRDVLGRHSAYHSNRLKRLEPERWESRFRAGRTSTYDRSQQFDQTHHEGHRRNTNQTCSDVVQRGYSPRIDKNYGNNYLFVKQITLKDKKKVLSISSEIMFFKTLCNNLYLKSYKYKKINCCNEILSSRLTVGISVLVIHVSVFKILSKMIISQLTFKSQLYSLPIFLQVEVYSLL